MKVKSQVFQFDNFRFIINLKFPKLLNIHKINQILTIFQIPKHIGLQYLVKEIKLSNLMKIYPFYKNS